MPRLVDRSPRVDPQRLVSDLVAPPRFSAESFQTYRPDPTEPTQEAAVAGLQAFAGQLDQAAAPRRRFRFLRPPPPEQRPGIYLDGGFGVGKTHLLASLFHRAPAPRAFGTFVEYTHLVGALGFSSTVAALNQHRLVCIDEFELDDPGDTVLMSSLLGGLVDAGVRLAATSNTLPGRLGEERFAAEDFLREIHGLARRFEVLRIDGPDYRHRGGVARQDDLSDEDVRRVVGAVPGATVDELPTLLAHLERVHPSRYGPMLDGVTAVGLTGAEPVVEDRVALRLVVLVDRLYDRAVPVRLGGMQPADLFVPRMLHGGYRKKYLRALSRLGVLTTYPVAGETYEI